MLGLLLGVNFSTIRSMVKYGPLIYKRCEMSDLGHIVILSKFLSGTCIDYFRKLENGVNKILIDNHYRTSFMPLFFLVVYFGTKSITNYDTMLIQNTFSAQNSAAEGCDQRLENATFTVCRDQNANCLVRTAS